MAVQQRHRRSATPARPASPTRVLADLPAQRSTSPDDGPRAATVTEEAAGRRWVAHPAAARAVQLLVLAVPLAASVAVALVVSAALPESGDLGTALLWWAIVVASSTLALYAVDRVARRLLPLAVLLRLSLLFPDQAPRRYRLAAQSWNSRRLREKVETARLSGETDAPIEAATQIIGLLASLSIHDRRTRGHCERVRAYNDLLAEEMGLPQADRDRLRWAALIHDIGKLKVSPRLLNKPGEPSRNEWSVLRAHPLRGAEIAAPLAGWLGPWGKAIEEHHERWDGAGYPHGLQGTEISLGARIVAVADAFEVMTSTRPYSRPVDASAARVELAECAGSHFDPVVVRAFLNISLGRLRKVMGPIAWLTQVPFVAGLPRLEAAIIGGGRQAAVGAGAAGAAAGVVAVSALTPAHVPGHGRTQHVAVTSVADATGERDADPSAVGAPALGFGTAAVAPQDPRPSALDGTAPKHHGHAATAARGHAASASEHAHGRAAFGHAQAAAHAAAGGKHRGQHGKSADHADHHHARLGGTSSAEHGRCVGNDGLGLGNGGPQPPATPQHPPWLDAPPATAHGLEVCE